VTAQVELDFPVDADPAVWERLAAPEVVAGALPGCRSAARAGDGDESGMHVTVDLAVASLQGLWAGTVERVDGDAVRVRGSGEPGTVDLVVRVDAARTRLTVEGSVDGALATVGAAVLAAAIRRLAADTLRAAGEPRGLELRSGQDEMAGSGVHVLDVAETELTVSRSGLRHGAARAAAGAGVVIVVLGGWRRLRRRAR
jgi:carbon monoxide dehydrogenase subunit G